MKRMNKASLLVVSLLWAAVFCGVGRAEIDCDTADSICRGNCGSDYSCWHQCMVGYDCDSNVSYHGNAGITFTKNSKLSFAASNCDEIRSYCYNMWIIGSGRNNVDQYTGCVLENAENNGIECTP